jgi:Polyketide cyclase / dehydrase and lipid transport
LLSVGVVRIGHWCTLYLLNRTINMVTLRNSTKIRTTPDEIFKWLKNLDKNYREWHPDHVKWTNETESLDEGNIAYYEEYIHGEMHKSKARIIGIEEDRRIEFANLFPMGIVCPKGSFAIEREGDHCVFTATLSFRFGWFFSRFARSRIKAIEMHMKEEGENLKKLLEKR